MNTQIENVAADLINTTDGAKYLRELSGSFGDLNKLFTKTIMDLTPEYKGRDEVIDDALLIAASFVAKHRGRFNKKEAVVEHAAGHVFVQAIHTIVLLEVLNMLEDTVPSILRDMAPSGNAVKAAAYAVNTDKIHSSIAQIADGSSHHMRQLMYNIVEYICANR